MAEKIQQAKPEVTELLPCPFCGGSAECRPNQMNADPTTAECQTCGARAFWRKWNIRAMLSAKPPLEGEGEELVERFVRQGLSIATIGTPSEIQMQIASNVARAAVEQLSATIAEREAELAQVNALPANCELSYYSPTYGDDEDQSEEWRVHKVTGSINDREWTLIGAGETPLAAIKAALAKEQSNA